MKALRTVLRLFLAEKRLMLALAFTLAALTGLAGVALLSLSGWFITATALAGLSSATALAFDVFAPSAGIRFLALFRTAGRYGERVISHDATLAVLAGMRELLFRSFARSRAARALERNPARLLFRLTLDVDALDGLYLRLIVPVGVALISALTALLALSFIDGATGIATGLFLIIGGFGVALMAAMRAEKQARLRAAALEALRSRVIDLVSGATDLLMAGRLGERRADVLAADSRLAEADDRLNRVETFAGFALAALAPMAGGILLVALAILVSRGTIGAPGAAFALLLVLAAAEPFTALKRVAVEAGRILAAAKRIAPQVEAEDDVVPPAPPPSDLAIRLENVTARHPGAARASLTAASLSIKQGETVALIGPSGAGKSTLLALIAHEIALDAGRLESLDASLLTQRAELFADTLAGNLRLAKPDATEDELWHVLTMAGLAETARALPDGLATWLGEGGAGLSGGERRRLSLARLLLHDAPILLLDEPTEALDQKTASDIMERLEAIKGQKTLLIATHAAREALIAERVFILVNGQFAGDYRRGDEGFDAAIATLRDA